MWPSMKRMNYNNLKHDHLCKIIIGHLWGYMSIVAIYGLMAMYAFLAKYPILGIDGHVPQGGIPWREQGESA
jgi:hypothetical protein